VLSITEENRTSAPRRKRGKTKKKRAYDTTRNAPQLRQESKKNGKQRPARVVKTCDKTKYRNQRKVWNIKGKKTKRELKDDVGVKRAKKTRKMKMKRRIIVQRSITHERNKREGRSSVGEGRVRGRRGKSESNKRGGGEQYVNAEHERVKSSDQRGNRNRKSPVRYKKNKKSKKKSAGKKKVRAQQQLRDALQGTQVRAAQQG